VENLAANFRNCFKPWHIENKIAVIVSDNAANVVPTVRVGGWRDLGCFAHTLNLIVQKGLKEIDSTLSKIRRIVTFFLKFSSCRKIKNYARTNEHPSFKTKKNKMFVRVGIRLLKCC
jgi:hypothetical protein